MESFEKRLERLTPEQRREVEDFVDFLLLKNNFRQDSLPLAPPPPIMLNTPPVLSADPEPARQPAPVMVKAPDLQDPLKPCPEDDESPGIHEITVGGGDWITRDYMDYGAFESQPSPATEAVKKVKQKIIARESEDKSRHIVDWVD